MCSRTSLPVLLDDIPVTRIRDLLLSPRRGSDNDALGSKIYNEVFREFSCNIAAGETAIDPKKAKADRLFKDDNVILGVKETRTEEFHSDFMMEMNVLSPSKGVTNRSIPASRNTEVRSPNRIASSVQNGSPSTPSKGKVTPKHKDADGQFETGTNFITQSRGVITRSMARLKNLGNQLEENSSSSSFSIRHNDSAASVLRSKTTGILTRTMAIRSDSKGSAVRRSNRLKKGK